MTLAHAILGLYYATLAVLALFGAHRGLLLVRWARTRHRFAPLPPPPGLWPRVTVQLPLYNERYVAQRLLRAVARLDYPADRLEIQVLDDSTDDTAEIVAAEVGLLAARGLAVRHLRRDVRHGFKAGALAAGLAVARGELLCIFDADFVPPADFLWRTVPYFADPTVGMVQACWDHLNRSASLLTRAQAVLLDGHFRIEQAARHGSGCFFNFNGTAGVWRRRAIEQAGGWQSDTLTEDLDLSYRAQLAGWRFVFLPDVVAPAELPVDVDSFKLQQHRWARGSIQTARKLLPRALAAPLPARVRLETFVHLTNNLSYPLMIVLALLLPPAMLLRRDAAAWTLAAVDLPLFASATLSVLAFYAASQAAARPDGRWSLAVLPVVLGLGVGLSVSNTAAVLGGLVRRGGTFERTPKLRAGERRRTAPAGYRASRHLSRWLELVLALYFLAATLAAVGLGMWASIPFLLLFLNGYSQFAILGLRRDVRAAPAPAAEAA